MHPYYILTRGLNYGTDVSGTIFESIQDLSQFDQHIKPEINITNEGHIEKRDIVTSNPLDLFKEYARVHSSDFSNPHQIVYLFNRIFAYRSLGDDNEILIGEIISSTRINCLYFKINKIEAGWLSWMTGINFTYNLTLKWLHGQIK